MSDIKSDHFSALVQFRAKDKVNFDEVIAPIAERFVEATAGEKAMLYYGFGRCDSDSRAFHCREAYTDAKGFLAHLKNVGGLLDEVTQYADITKVVIIGTEDDIKNDDLRKSLRSFPTQYLALTHTC